MSSQSMDVDHDITVPSMLKLRKSLLPKGNPQMGATLSWRLLSRFISFEKLFLNGLQETTTFIHKPFSLNLLL